MHIRVHCRSVALTPSIDEWATRRLLFALGQFGTRIRSVVLRLSDENGPRGGSDQRCLIEARIVNGGSVVAQVQDRDMYAAISRAAERVSRRVRAELDRERAGRRINTGRRGKEIHT